MNKDFLPTKMVVEPNIKTLRITNRLSQLFSIAKQYIETQMFTDYTDLLFRASVFQLFF